MTYFSLQNGREAVAVVTPADSDASRDDVFSRRIEIAEAQVVHISHVWFWVVKFVNLVVVLDDFIQNLGKGSVCLRVAGVDTNTAVEVQAS